MNIHSEITIKIEPFFVFKQPTKISCPHCQNAEMVSTDKAASLIGCNPRAIFGWVELGWLHFMETSESLLVCMESLGKINIK